MPSPFPGMDPYLEDPAVWPDFHVTFLTALRPELNQVVSPRYLARVDRYVREAKPYMKILDPRNHRVVTVIELLSPSNKAPGKDRDAYLLKRREYLASGINLVEMDLLRSGLRAPVNESLPAADYFILVSWAADAPRAGVWPLSVRDVLPTIPVPLAGEDPPAQLALQRCFTRAFDEARYAEEVDYDNPPVPPLAEPEATWARELLAQRQR